MAESSVQGMWQNIIPLMQMVMQQRAQAQQIKIQQQGVEQNAFQLFSDLARSSATPEQTDAIINDFSNRFGLDPAALRNYAAIVAPHEGVVRSNAQKEGMRNVEGTPTGERIETGAYASGVTGALPGELEQDEFTRQVFEGGLANLDSLTRDTVKRYALVRGGTGLTPGELLFDEAAAAMSPEDVGLSVLMQKGLRLTASERENLALGYANLRQDERALDQQFELAMYDRELARIQGSQRGVEDIPTLIELKTRVAQGMVDTAKAGRMTDHLRQTYMYTLAAINRELQFRGVTTEDVGIPGFSLQAPATAAPDAGPGGQYQVPSLGPAERFRGWMEGRVPLTSGQ